jgi:hypothetical protein
MMLGVIDCTATAAAAAAAAAAEQGQIGGIDYNLILYYVVRRDVDYVPLRQVEIPIDVSFCRNPSFLSLAAPTYISVHFGLGLILGGKKRQKTSFVCSSYSYFFLARLPNGFRKECLPSNWVQVRIWRTLIRPDALAKFFCLTFFYEMPPIWIRLSTIICFELCGGGGGGGGGHIA